MSLYDIISQIRGKRLKMEENDLAIEVKNVYKTFNVYLDKANTIKERLLFLFSRNRSIKRYKFTNKKRRSCSTNRY